MESINDSYHQAVEKREPWTVQAIQDFLELHPVVLFARGTREQPRCGYTARCIDYLDELGITFEILDVSVDKTIIPAVNALFGRCSFPVVVANQQLIGSSQELEACSQTLLAVANA